MPIRSFPRSFLVIHPREHDTHFIKGCVAVSSRQGCCDGRHHHHAELGFSKPSFTMRTGLASLVALHPLRPARFTCMLLFPLAFSARPAVVLEALLSTSPSSERNLTNAETAHMKRWSCSIRLLRYLTCLSSTCSGRIPAALSSAKLGSLYQIAALFATEPGLSAFPRFSAHLWRRGKVEIIDVHLP